jgi:hypothetical protein
LVPYDVVLVMSNVFTLILFDVVRLSDVELKLKLHDIAIKESVPTASRLEKLKW